MKQGTAIIIGGGIGGLFTGAILAKEGWKVTVLEKNAAIGGGLSTFRRDGIDFQPGMHIVGGFGEGSAVGRVFKELGITAEVRDCPRRMVVLSDNSLREIPSSEAAVVDMLSREFPDQQDGIRGYYEKIREIYDSVPLLNGSDGGIFSPSEDELVSADRLVDSYVSDARLKAILGSLNLLSGTEAGLTPAYVHAIINELYTRQFAYFPDGTGTIVSQLIDIIVNGGGKVVGNAEVVSVRCDKGTDRERIVTGVETTGGTIWQGDIYISSVSPAVLSDLGGEHGAFTKMQRRRIENLRDGFSMFTLYASVEDDSTIPDGATFCFPDYSSVWKQGSLSEDGDWLHGVLFVRDGRQLTAMAAMPFSEVSRWQHTRLGQRGEEYVAWKSRQAERILGMIEAATDICRPRHCNGSGINLLCSASPLSIRDWLGNRNGAAYGFSISCDNPAASRFSPRTKAENLYQTGQNLYLHGLCGTLMSTVMTTGQILDKNQ